MIKVFRLHLHEVLPALERCARRLRQRPHVRRVILFGSLVRGNYAPGSDADILIELSDDERNWRERIPEYLQAFSGCPIPVEVFPFTEAEVRSAMEKGDLFITSIVQHGRELGMAELETTVNGE